MQCTKIHAKTPSDIYRTTSTTGERLIGLFLFGLLLFMPPLIGVFDKAHLVGGIPMLYLYLFLAWAILIALLALIVERLPSDDDLGEGEQARFVGTENTVFV